MRGGNWSGVSSNVVLEELGWEILANDSEAFTPSPF